MVATPGVYAKVHQLAQHADALEIKRRNIPKTKTAQGKTFGGYTAWATNDIATALRPKMAELGLWLSTCTSVASTSNGYLVTAEAVWVDLTDGSRMPAGIHVADSSHQIGPAAGATVAVREILVKGFQLGDSRDFDHDPARYDDTPPHDDTPPPAVASAPSSRRSQAAGPERSLPADNSERVRDALIAAAGGDTDAADAEWTRQGFDDPGRRNAGNVRYACELLSAKPAAEGEEPF